MRPRRLMAAALVWLSLNAAGCGNTVADESDDPVAAIPEATSADAQRLYKALFSAAEAGDVDAFKALLTPESVVLLDRWFDAQHQRLAPEAAGWPEFLKDHARLGDDARRRAPYPVRGAGPDARLDVAAHPDADFFRDAVRQLEAGSQGEVLD